MKTILITGGTSGVGFATACLFDKLGWQVVVLARDQEKMVQAERKLSSRARWIVCDISKIEAVQNAFAQIQTSGTQIDVLVNNAGVGRTGHISQLSLADYDLVMNTNVRGMWLVTKTFLPLIKKTTGLIINLASMAGLRGFANGTAYCASKFAVRGFSEALREDLIKEGIRVAVISPGMIDTSFFDQQKIAPKPGAALTPSQIADLIKVIVEQEATTAISEITVPSARFGLLNKE